ncbi:MAG: hypothetical protein JXB15_01585 [Anaerolineales bacterium]|nr:hypothetical protein [Anaerolineales bacterium]
MSKKRLLKIFFALLIPMAIVGLFAYSSYVQDLPNRLSQHETIVLGQNRFTPGSQANLRVLVRDSRDGAPLPDAEIELALRPSQGGKTLLVYRGRTDAQGSAAVAFQVPEELAPDQVLEVKTSSSLGSDTLERPVTVARDYRILLSTDKPLYQPGQVIHLRALALSTFDLQPAAGQELEIMIADGKGNRVFRKKLTTSEFGAAWVDFQLASEVNSGAYKITAALGNTSSEKTVTVEHYVLPKFAVTLETERAFYLPGEHVKGALKANYFFGKPVSAGQVRLEGYTFDVQKNLAFNLQGTTDANGDFSFEFDLPGYLTGSELEGGLGRFYLEAMVTDQALHSEVANLSLPVSGSALVIEAIPEGGKFRSGLENILYVLVSYPDGAPAQASLSLTFYNENNQNLQAETGAYGLAEVRLNPQYPYQQILIEARDLQGHTAQREFYFEGEYSQESVLLRPEKPVYRVGDAMRLYLMTSQPKGTVYLDIVREGQTVSTRSVEVDNGKAEVIVDLTPDLYGTLELHAYKILRSGATTRDTRLVVVDHADDLSIQFNPSQEVYRPGDPASLMIQVNGQDGAGARAALGLAIVDEAVFALAEQDPGFAKLYFMLEQELLVPRYDLHGFSVPELVKGVPVDSPELLTAIEDTAQASLAAATRQGAAFSLEANSHIDAQMRAIQKQAEAFSGLSKVLFVFFLLIPLAVLGLNGFTLWKKKSLGSSLAIVLALLAVIALLVLLWPLGQDAEWARTPADRLGLLMEWLFYQNSWMLAILALLSLLGLFTLIGIAWKRREASLGWSLGLLALFFVVLGFMVFALAQSGLSPDEGYIVLGLVSLACLPLAFLLRSGDFLRQRQIFPGLAAFLSAIFLIFGAVAIPSLSFNMRSAGGMEDLMMQAPRPAGLLNGALPVVEEVDVMKEVETGAAPPSEADEAQTSQAPRLRQYFPETMLWIPDAETGPDGALELDFPVADSITTWRITALASTQDGRFGSTTAGLRVFQDFFIDLDLPLALTVDDEISIPVGVFNYLAEPQTVQLELEQADWFQLLDEPVKQIEIAANDISVVYFRIKAVDFGLQPFKVTALGSKMSDAILKEVHVYPNGKHISYTQSDRLEPGQPVSQSVVIPGEVIPGTQTLLVKIYPGILSQVVEGLDSILRMPYGCFEQTTSITYPNALVLDYLKTTNQASPEVQMKAEEYINLGYQRLTTFEVQSSGGFSLFGEAPADRMLTAYGLQEFADMSRVYDIDPALVQRAAEWLLNQQASDGSWENDRGLVHENTWSSLGDDRLPVTAYIAWSLVEAGYGDESRTKAGIAYVRENSSKAEDAYVLALVANALVAADMQSGEKVTPGTEAVLDRLAQLAVAEGNGAYWPSGVATFMGSEGQTGSIETTALVALAFLRSNTHPDLGNAALLYLVQQKDNFGTWYSTQATVLALKALIQSVRAGGESTDASVTITLNGGQKRSVQVNQENFDVVQLLSFDDLNPGKDNLVQIEMQGEGNLMYQITGGYYLPWEKLALYPELVPTQELVTIQVDYDRTELAVNDTVNVNVTITLNEPGGKAESALIDLGLPPGFTVLTEDLQAPIARFNDVPEDYALPTIQRYELTGRQIMIYVSNLSFGSPLQFSFRLRALFPLLAQTPASSAYDYYNPNVAGEAKPETLTVVP